MGKKKKSINQPESGEKTFPWIAVVAALIAAVGYVVVALINRSTAITTTLKPIEFTQTAEALHTMIAMQTPSQPLVNALTLTPAFTPTTKTFEPLSTPSSITTNMLSTTSLPINADKVSFYVCNKSTSGRLTVLISNDYFQVTLLIPSSECQTVELEKASYKIAYFQFCDGCSSDNTPPLRS